MISRRYRLAVNKNDPEVKITIPEEMLIAIENQSILQGRDVSTHMLILFARSLEAVHWNVVKEKV